MFLGEVSMILSGAFFVGICVTLFLSPSNFDSLIPGRDGPSSFHPSLVKRRTNSLAVIFNIEA